MDGEGWKNCAKPMKNGAQMKELHAHGKPQDPREQPQTIPNGFATSAKISAAFSRCSLLCAALTIARSRAFPSATVGYATAGANTPASNNFRENSYAFAPTPT